jgi:hypothetical protein
VANSLRRIILAPAVEYPDVVRFAEALRAAQLPAVLTYATLESSKPRRPELRAARDARVRVVDLDTRATGERLVSIADETLIAGKYLYRDVDDEGRDECIPSREWLQATFAVSGLEWLLEAFRCVSGHCRSTAVPPRFARIACKSRRKSVTPTADRRSPTCNRLTVHPPAKRVSTVAKVFDVRD